MPICTYLTDDETKKPTSDVELNALLAQVRDATGDDWRIRERVHMVRRWFSKPVEVKRYTLFNHIGGVEYQIINFYRPDCAEELMASINTSNDAGYVAAYLCGLLAGLEHLTTETSDEQD